MNNNFWRCCPLQLTEFPKAECSLAKKPLKTGGCQWSISSASDKNCFWTYVRRVSAQDGSMPQANFSQISRLLNIPSAEVEESLKKALSTLKQHPDFAELSDFI